MVFRPRTSLWTSGVAALAHRPHPCHPEGELGGVVRSGDSECRCAQHTRKERQPQRPEERLLYGVRRPAVTYHLERNLLLGRE